jgi:hypothetical protein
MADAPSPAPVPQAAPTAPPESHPGDFNQAQLETVRKSEGVARTAAKAEYKAKLVEEGMEAGTPDALLAKATAWRALSRKAVEATGGKEEATGLGTDAETALRREVEFYRGKARLAITKHREWKEPEIDAFKARYFINKDIFTSRALAEQSAGDIFQHAGEDALPGVTPARLAASAAALAAYTGTEAPQTGAQADATTLRSQRDAAFAEVIRLRQEIQFAADTAWPWHDDQNLGIRREFLLPAGRAFTG